MRRRQFGSVERLPSGRYRARWFSGDVVIKAPTTFRTKSAASAWLAREQVRSEAEASGSPRAVTRRHGPTVREYTERWLSSRPLRPSTAHTYRSYVRNHVLPSLGDKRLEDLSVDVIEQWHRALAPDSPTVRARSYAFLKTVLGTAVEEGLLSANPCRIRGASSARVVTDPTILSAEQVSDLASAMSPSLSLAVLLGAWGQLRVGEALALRRKDLDLSRGLVRVRRAVTWQGRRHTIGPPKTSAGVRDVHLPPALLPAVREHLSAHVGPGPEALLFPGEPHGVVPVRLDTFTQKFKSAVRRSDLPSTMRFHHLRHTGLTLLAEAGASVAELQSRAGHSTPGIALRYQHARAERDRALSEKVYVVLPTSPQPPLWPPT